MQGQTVANAVAPVLDRGIAMEQPVLQGLGNLRRGLALAGPGLRPLPLQHVRLNLIDEDWVVSYIRQGWLGPLSVGRRK